MSSINQDRTLAQQLWFSAATPSSNVSSVTELLTAEAWAIVDGALG